MALEKFASCSDFGNPAEAVAYIDLDAQGRISRVVIDNPLDHQVSWTVTLPGQPTLSGSVPANTLGYSYSIPPPMRVDPETPGLGYTFQCS